MMPGYKTVTVTVNLRLRDEQPVVDWLPAAIEQQLDDEETIISYNDNEPEVEQ